MKIGRGLDLSLTINDWFYIKFPNTDCSKSEMEPNSQSENSLNPEKASVAGSNDSLIASSSTNVCFSDSMPGRSLKVPSWVNSDVALCSAILIYYPTLPLYNVCVYFFKHTKKGDYPPP